PTASHLPYTTLFRSNDLKLSVAERTPTSSITSISTSEYRLTSEAIFAIVSSSLAILAKLYEVCHSLTSRNSPIVSGTNRFFDAKYRNLLRMNSLSIAEAVVVFPVPGELE